MDPEGDDGLDGMDSTAARDAADGANCCKVGRSASAYGLANLDGDLRRRHERGESLRDLATFVNRRILGRAIDGADVNAVSDADTLYDLLTDEELSAGRRTEIREKLTRSGVDLAAVESSYVSHQTVRDHLRECLSVDTSVGSDVDAESARGTIEWARARFLGIAERTLERLEAAGELTVGSVEVTATVRATCTDCGETYRLGVLVDRGHCGCADDPVDASREGGGEG